MIFFFGTRNTTILTEYIRNLTCIHCNNENTIYVAVISSHFHVFWIPIFPVSKNVYTVCQHCQQTFVEPKMPDTYRAAVRGYRMVAKAPVWQYFGLIVIGVCLAVPAIIGIGGLLISKIQGS